MNSKRVISADDTGQTGHLRRCRRVLVLGAAVMPLSFAVFLMIRQRRADWRAWVVQTLPTAATIECGRTGYGMSQLFLQDSRQCPVHCAGLITNGTCLLAVSGRAHAGITDIKQYSI